MPPSTFTTVGYSAGKILDRMDVWTDHGLTDLVLEAGWAMEKKTRCFGYVGDYAVQLFGDYNKPLLYKDPC